MAGLRGTTASAAGVLVHSTLDGRKGLLRATQITDSSSTATKELVGTLCGVRSARPWDVAAADNLQIQITQMLDTSNLYQYTTNLFLIFLTQILKVCQHFENTM